jgi:nicotinamidase-related amidase
MKLALIIIIAKTMTYINQGVYAMNQTALIVIDIQNDYFPGGLCELEKPLEAAAQARKVMDAFRAHDLPVIHIRHESIRPGVDFLLADTPGNEIHELAKPMPNEIVYLKHYPNSFKDTPLLDHLREGGVKELVLVGMMTFMCVHATARAASDLDFGCTVLQDATATKAISFNGVDVPAAQVQAAFHGALAFAYADVMDTEGYLRRLTQTRRNS